MEQTPANDAAHEEEQPKLELVPALDEPDTVAAEPADALDTPAPVQDPLKLYVRQIGDGRRRSASSPNARTRAMRRPSGSSSKGTSGS
jgi:hypothetical protein